MIAGRCRICPVTLCPSCMELRAQQHPTIIRLLNEPSLLEKRVIARPSPCFSNRKANRSMESGLRTHAAPSDEFWKYSFLPCKLLDILYFHQLLSTAEYSPELG